MPWKGTSQHQRAQGLMARVWALLFLQLTQTLTTSQEITFLDLDIYISNNSYQTKAHFKPTNTFSYLHGSSNHPPSTFKGVHKGENIRILGNTSEEHQYTSTMSFITTQFRKRKYPPWLTNSPVIPFNDRATYLTTAERDKNLSTSFITTFDPTISVRDSLLKDWPRLSSHPELRTVFTSPPMITYKRSRNLSQLLVRAKPNHNVTSDLPTTAISIERPPSFPAKTSVADMNNVPLVHSSLVEVFTPVTRQRNTSVFLIYIPVTLLQPSIF